MGVGHDIAEKEIRDMIKKIDPDIKLCKVDVYTKIILFTPLDHLGRVCDNEDKTLQVASRRI